MFYCQKFFFHLISLDQFVTIKNAQIIREISCDKKQISCQQCCQADWDCNSLCSHAPPGNFLAFNTRPCNFPSISLSWILIWELMLVGHPFSGKILQPKCGPDVSLAKQLDAHINVKDSMMNKNTP